MSLIEQDQDIHIRFGRCVTVNYHKDKLGQFSNAPVEAPNDLDAISKLIR